MSIGKMTKDEILEHAAREMAELMFMLTTECKGHERDISGMLARQLAQYVAIVSKNPAAALKAVAKIVEEAPYGDLRAEHFGYTLGVDAPRKAERRVLDATGPVVQIGEYRGKSDGGHSEDPA